MMEQILAVQRMQDYIEENLDKRITLSDLAQDPISPHGIPIAYSGIILR